MNNLPKLIASLVVTASCCISQLTWATEAPLVSIPSQDAFFNSIKALCGKAYSGKIALDSNNSGAFANQTLIMHVRRCTDNQLQIPLQVGDDASRTWLITKTGSGLSFKHDHRLQDGSYDSFTMYGGHTLDAGFANMQSFPADQYTKELAVQHGIPEAVENIWQVFIYPDKFTYRMIRHGKEYRLDFDLRNPVTPPKTPWGYKD